MKTNTELNKLAAEVLGICVCYDHKAKCPSCTDPLHWQCSECKRIYESDYASYLESLVPDFCNDLNAAQKLFNTAAELTDGGYIGQCIINIAWDSEYLRTDMPDLLVANVVSLPAKTITLAALVALGKISPEEAKECLR